MSRTQRECTVTARDEQILSTLACRVRCLSIGQVAACWWGMGRPAAVTTRRRLAVLEQHGYVQSADVLARPILDLAAPLVRWCVADAKPAFGPIAQILKTRMTAPTRTVRLVVATAKAARREGGRTGRIPRRSEVTHDLSLAQVYLNLARCYPARAVGWQSEAELVARGEGRGQKLPDALIVEPNGCVTVIEFGGEYDKAKLEAFHADCLRRQRNYEIW